VKIDLADDEYVENVAKDVMLEDLWSDLPQPLAFDVYPLDEIAAEKLRCVIQRVQCRDLYDLLRLTQDLKVPLGELRPLFEATARVKALDPAIFRERFEDRIERYRERWNREMDEHLADPPRFDDAERIVRRHLREAGLV
jgi:predicted nucleotidyltransferase component of viral defense system